MWDPFVRVRVAAVRGLRDGPHGGVLLQAAGVLSVVLWASDEDFSGGDGLDLVGRMSETFGLPVLTTSGLREATADDERRTAEHVSPWQAVARRLGRKSVPSPSEPD